MQPISAVLTTSVRLKPQVYYGSDRFVSPMSRLSLSPPSTGLVREKQGQRPDQDSILGDWTLPSHMTSRQKSFLREIIRLEKKC